MKLDDDDSIVSNFYIEKFFHKRLPAAVLDFGEDIQVITFREMRDVLYQDLNKLTRAFEIYLCEYVGKIESVKISKEIKSLGIDHVLSFNYSHTYQKLYDKPKKIKYDYIHGESRINSTIESNNMVLGIDEYLNKKSKDKEIDFIAFKKYYQRIYKKLEVNIKIGLMKLLTVDMKMKWHCMNDFQNRYHIKNSTLNISYIFSDIHWILRIRMF